jgi:hypothetical protein
MERRVTTKNEQQRGVVVGSGWAGGDYEQLLPPGPVVSDHPSYLAFPPRGGEEEEEVEYQVTAWRWWVLFVFSFASFLQSLVWFTFSSVPKVVKEYYPGTHTRTRTRTTARMYTPGGLTPGLLLLQAWMRARSTCCW